MGLTKRAAARILKEQSRAEQSRVSKTLSVYGTPIFARAKNNCKKDAVPAW